MQITDNTILTLTSILAEATANEDAVCYVTSADAPALKEAIDTMRKYQKIQAIAEKCNLKLLPKEAMSTFMKDVLEVLEDGI